MTQSESLRQRRAGPHEHFCFGCYAKRGGEGLRGWWRCNVVGCEQNTDTPCSKHLPVAKASGDEVKR